MKKFRAPFLSEEKFQKFNTYLPEKKEDRFFLYLFGLLAFCLVLFLFAKFLFGLALGLLIGIPLGVFVYEYWKQNKRDTNGTENVDTNENDFKDKQDLTEKKVDTKKI